MATNSTIRLSHDRTASANRALTILSAIMRKFAEEKTLTSLRIFPDGRVSLTIHTDDLPVFLDISHDDVMFPVTTFSVSNSADEQRIETNILRVTDFYALTVTGRERYAEDMAELHFPQILAAARHLVDITK